MHIFFQKKLKIASQTTDVLYFECFINLHKNAIKVVYSLLYYYMVETGTGFLNRRHFEFYHGDAPCFKFDILNLNFPPFLGENCKKFLLSCLLGSNPGPSPCEASMLPQDHRVWYKLSGKKSTRYNQKKTIISFEPVLLNILLFSFFGETDFPNCCYLDLSKHYQ